MMQRKTNSFRCYSSLVQLIIIVTITITPFVKPTSISTSLLSDFRGVRLNFLAFHNPPYDILIRGPNGTFQSFGAGLNIVTWLAARFNFTMRVMPINETLIELYGTHEASFNELINKDIDGILCAFYLTPDRIERMSFTFPTWAEGFNMVVPKPGHESRLFAFIRPFQPTVWLLILISVLVIIATMSLFGRFYRHHRMTKMHVSTSLSSYMIYVVNVLTNQGYEAEPNDRHSYRILAGFWLLGAMVLVNSYSGIVISSLTVPKMKPSIDSFEDLANSNEVGLVLRYDTYMGEQILKATAGVYKVLGDKARSNPDQIVADSIKVSSKLATGRYAFPHAQTFGYFFVATQYKKDGGRCRFQVSKLLSSATTGYYSLLFKKGNPYVHSISQGLMDLWEAGMVRYWVKEMTPKADKCFAAEKKRQLGRQVPIRLSDVTSAFLILGIGIGLATLTFCMERIRSSYQRVRASRRS